MIRVLGECKMWHVHGSIPPTDGRTWRTNKTVTVLAPSAAFAISAACEHAPGFHVAQVMLIKSDAVILLDDAAVEEALGKQ